MLSEAVTLKKTLDEKMILTLLSYGFENIIKDVLRMFWQGSQSYEQTSLHKH